MRRRAVTLAAIAVFAGLAPAWSQPAPSPPSTTQIGIAFMERPATAVPRGAALRAVKIVADWSVIEAQRGAPIWGDLDRAVVLAEPSPVDTRRSCTRAREARSDRRSEGREDRRHSPPC